MGLFRSFVDRLVGWVIEQLGHMGSQTGWNSQ
uniref:Uncharacterized protein n=1 Tax=Anguilla anguilla TaxID=7936 RepID=A0A0E9RPI4_ANGAN